MQGHSGCNVVPVVTSNRVGKETIDDSGIFDLDDHFKFQKLIFMDLRSLRISLEQRLKKQIEPMSAF
jgi:hypothetical protein